MKNIAFLFVLMFSTSLLSLGNENQDNVQSLSTQTQSTFLGAEVAFQFSPKMENNRLYIKWNIKKEHFLIIDRTKILSKSFTHCKWSGDVSKKTSAYFGKVQVVTNQATMICNILEKDKDWYNVELEYQGLFKDELAYARGEAMFSMEKRVLPSGISIFQKENFRPTPEKIESLKNVPTSNIVRLSEPFQLEPTISWFETNSSRNTIIYFTSSYVANDNIELHLADSEIRSSLECCNLIILDTTSNSPVLKKYGVFAVPLYIVSKKKVFGPLSKNKMMSMLNQIESEDGDNVY